MYTFYVNMGNKTVICSTSSVYSALILCGIFEDNPSVIDFNINQSTVHRVFTDITTPLHFSKWKV